MRARGALVAVLMSLAAATPALAWDPERPRESPPAPVSTPDPAPFIAPPPGVYYVTDTYVDDVVTRSGPLTMYSTETVHESTGSYASVLDVVGTGVASAYDGSSFNGRASLGDGRLVAGTYYRNYVLEGATFVPVSIVFFQDDAELAREAARPSPAPATPRPSVPPASSPALCCLATSAPVPSGSRPAPPIEVRPGVSILPASAPLALVEVLRGRQVSLWLRASSGGRDVAVRSWTLVSGDGGDATALAGPGTVPFRTAWDRLAPSGTRYDLVFRIVVDLPDGTFRVLDAPISVVVRSPALFA